MVLLLHIVYNYTQMELWKYKIVKVGMMQYIMLVSYNDIKNN